MEMTAGRICGSYHWTYVLLTYTRSCWKCFRCRA